MNLETSLDERLWRAVQSAYNDRNFTGAILDAIYYLGDLIREKTGLEADGTALAGQAFGGKTPLLKINKLQTDSERNIQSGVEQLLRGLYQAIRNPRSHEKHADKQSDADAIILFVNYLVGVIDQSKSPFTKSEFLARVFDQSFVEKDRYAQILVEEIPPKHRIEVMLDVLRDKETGEGRKLRYFVVALLEKLTEDERAEVYGVVSDELKATENDTTVRLILQIFPDDLLNRLDEAARLRTENKLIGSIAEGRYDSRTRKCTAGALGTWAVGRCGYFLLKEELKATLIRKLRSENTHENEYVFQFLWHEFPTIETPPSDYLMHVIKGKLKAGNRRFFDQLSVFDMVGNGEWIQPLREAMAAFKEREPTSPMADDDLPF